MHAYLVSESLCLKDVQKSEKAMENCLATQSCHRYRQEGLAFEPAGHWIQTKSKSRERFGCESLADNSCGAQGKNDSVWRPDGLLQQRLHVSQHCLHNENVSL